MIQVKRDESGDRWVRLETGKGLALSIHAPHPGFGGTFSCHLDFEYGLESSDLEGLVHFEPDPKTPLQVDRSGYAEVNCITGDTEVYTTNPDQFLSLLRELVERGEQELTGLQEAASPSTSL